MPRALHAVAFLPLVALVLLLAALVWKAMPAIRYNGFGFFTGSVWNLGSTYSPIVTTHGVRHPAGAVYGALPLIIGTLQSSFIALVLAVPVGIGTALVVVEKLPPDCRAAWGSVSRSWPASRASSTACGASYTRSLPGPRHRPARGQRHARRSRARLLPG